MSPHDAMWTLHTGRAQQKSRELESQQNLSPRPSLKRMRCYDHFSSSSLSFHPPPAPCISRHISRARSVPNSAHGAKAVMMTSMRDKDPASQNSGLIRKDDETALAARGGETYGKEVGVGAQLGLRARPGWGPGSTASLRKPVCPSGRLWALNSKQASDGVDMLVHMSYLAQKTDCPRLTGVPTDTDGASGPLLKRKIF